MIVGGWDLVVDVGANYDEMLVSGELPAASSLVAFEPNPRVLPYLKRTLSELGRPVELVERAVADETRDAATFLIDEDWSGTSGLPRHVPEHTFGHGHMRTPASVPVTTLDTHFAANQLASACIKLASACIKIDVEGYERAVLAGAQELLKRARHWAVVLEVLHLPGDALSELASRHPLYFLSTQSLNLVRLRAGEPEQIHRQMAEALLYPQDALMVNAPLLVEDEADAFALSGHHIDRPAQRPVLSLPAVTSAKPGRAYSFPVVSCTRR